MLNRIEKYVAEVKRAFYRMKMERRMAAFRKLLSEDKAWALYLMCVENYILRCKSIKASTNLGKATPEILKTITQMDTEIATLEWAIKIPQATINASLVAEQRQAEQNLLEEIDADVKKQGEKQ